MSSTTSLPEYPREDTGCWHSREEKCQCQRIEKKSLGSLNKLCQVSFETSRQALLGEDWKNIMTKHKSPLVL